MPADSLYSNDYAVFPVSFFGGPARISPVLFRITCLARLA